MRIICTVTNDLSHDQRMNRICEALQDAGHSVCLVGRLLPESPPLIDRSFEQVRLKCRFRRGKLFYLEYNIRLWWYLQWREMDAVNAVDLDTLLACFAVSKLHGIPCVYDAHEYFTETPEVVRRPITQKAWEVFAGWILPQLKYAYTVGNALAKLMSKRYGISFEVIRNLPKQSTRQTADKISKKVILYQGMLNEGRGLEIAIEAMTQLPNLELWLVGKGDVEVKLRGLVKELGLEQQVHFLGFMPPEDLPTITAKAWLGLNLLENRGLSYYYSLANKAFDYIQNGVPSVQMDFPEYRNIQEEFGCFILLEELAAEKLAALIRHIHQDDVLYEQLSDNCEVAAKELCWEKEVDRLIKFWDQVV